MTKDQQIELLLKLIPSYSYRMCYNGSGEVYDPSGAPYDIFNNKKGLIRLLYSIAEVSKVLYYDAFLIVKG